MKNFILLTLGTGIGGGIVINGEIYKGHTGMAGHLGHFPVNPEGIRCGCGNIGCVETEFSAGAFDRKIGILNAEHPCSPAIIDTHDLFRRAESGDDLALGVLRRAVFFLAQAISGYANALDPEKVILSGGIAQSGDFLMGLLHETLKPVLWMKSPEAFVIYSPLGAQMGLFGAGAVGEATLRRAAR
jgi:glucokinase